MSFADRLNALFAQTAGPSGRPMTLQEVVDRMASRGIATMSLSYLQQLRSGQAENPRLKHVAALADAFGVAPTYFLDEESEGQNGDSLTPMERSVALRVHGLSPESLRSITSMIDIARKSEGLDNVSRGD